MRNKDRQDPAAVIRLADERLIEYLQKLDFVSHTIIPETDHFTEYNRVGMYPHPISIAVGPFGSLLFLTLNQETGTSNLYMAQLHNPVQKVEVIKTVVPAKEVHLHNNIMFLVGNHGKLHSTNSSKEAFVSMSLNCGTTVKC